MSIGHHLNGLRSHSRQEVDNIQMDANKAECGNVDWIHLAQDCVPWRVVVSTIKIFRVP
jgi:hypothetical protein